MASVKRKWPDGDGEKVEVRACRSSFIRAMAGEAVAEDWTRDFSIEISEETEEARKNNNAYI